MKIRFEDAPSAAEQSRGLHVDYVVAKRNMPAWRWNVIVLLLVSPAFYLLGSALLDQVWISAPGVVQLKEVHLHAGQGGRIEFIVPEGARVDAGATLAVLQPPPGETEPAAEPSRPQAQPDSRAGAGLLAFRRDRARRYRQLWVQGAATQAEMATAQAQLAEAEAAYRRARPPAPIPRQRPLRPEAIRIAAPEAGVVARVSGNAGDWVAAGSELLVLMDDAESDIVAYLDPRHLRYARPGQAVRLKFPDGKSIPARVLRIRNQTGSVTPGLGDVLKKNAEALQLVLAPDETLPQRYRTQGLPVEVYFNLEFPWHWKG